MALVGKVLWWSARDGKGVIEDPQGNEYYFDSSVVSASKVGKIRTGKLVRFEINKAIRGTLCACNVNPPSSKESQATKRAYERQISEAVI